jgi:predicted amidohydrolase
MAPNLAAAGDLVRRARDAGAALIALPENVSLIVQGRAAVLANARSEAEHPGLPFFRELAIETGAWLLVGSLHVLVADNLAANRGYLFDPEGRIAATYDKIHMFDVDLAGGESYRESATFRPGDQAVVAPTPWGALGMTICYDVRFPQLYLDLARAGAEMLSVPAAFTVPTGRAHWHVLLRARAIETGSFVIAPAQCGSHDGGRRTYGHSLIVSPWGEVRADGGEQPGIIVADIDLAEVDEARRMVPSLRHGRTYAPSRQPAAANAVLAGH